MFEDFEVEAVEEGCGVLEGGDVLEECREECVEMGGGLTGEL